MAKVVGISCARCRRVFRPGEFGYLGVADTMDNAVCGGCWDAHEHPPRVEPAHRTFLALWIAALGAIALGEFVFDLTTRPMWIGLGTYIAVVEAWALIRKGPRDEMTYFWHWFRSGGKDRIPIVVGFGVYAALRIISISAMGDMEAMHPILRWGPPVALWGGFGSWLVPHLLKGGRDG